MGSRSLERGNKKLRILDRWLGPFVLLFLRIFVRPWRRKIKQNDQVAVMKLAGIGDLVLLSGCLIDLKNFFPKKKITLLVGRENGGYASCLRGVDRVIVVNVTSPILALKQVRSQEYDLVLNFDSWSRWAAVLSAVMRTRQNVGFRTPGQWRHLADDLSVPHQADLHEIENDRNILRALHIRAVSPPQNVGHFVWQNEESHVLVFHLWASGVGGRLKEWPAERWRSLIRRIPEPFRIALTGAASDEPRIKNFCESLEPSERSRIFFKTGLSFFELATFLRGARGYVGVDTGVSHVAASLGVPSVVIYGPSNPGRWGPVGDRTVALFKPSPSADFFNLGFEMSNRLNRIESVTEADVVGGLQELGILETP